MSDLILAKIKGKQYKIIPNVPFLVDRVSGKEIEGSRLDQPGKTLKLQVLQEVKGPKIRVAKYSAKANYRRVRGHRQKYSQVVYKG